MGQHFPDHFEGVNDVSVELVEIVEGVGSLPDAEHGINEALHVAKVGDHLLFQVGPCLAMLSFVEDGPVLWATPNRAADALA